MEEPMIRGKYVRCHLKYIEAECNPETVRTLRERFAGKLDFRRNDFVPIWMDNEILEAAARCLKGNDLPRQQLAYEAGRLHYRAFSETIMWQVLTRLFGKNLRLLLQQSPLITARIYRGTQFSSESYGERSGRITIINQGYPLEHFRGFFEEYLHERGFNGYADGQEFEKDRIAYNISWSEPHIRVVFEESNLQPRA